MTEFKIFIRDYDSTNKRFEVLYTPFDDRCLFVNKGVIIYNQEEMSEEQILSAIKRSAPYDEWQRQIESFEKDHSLFKSLVNREIFSDDIVDQNDDIVTNALLPPVVEPAPQVTSEVDAFIAEILNAQTNPQS
jgi:hypothetical protein